jgi:hypothetical protein
VDRLLQAFELIIHILTHHFELIIHTMKLLTVLRRRVGMGACARAREREGARERAR